MKTIRQIATECGVSEQAVRAWCRRNNVAKDAKGSFAIDESVKTAIYQHYRVVEGNLRNLRNGLDCHDSKGIRPEK